MLERYSAGMSRCNHTYDCMCTCHFKQKCRCSRYKGKHNLLASRTASRALHCTLQSDSQACASRVCTKLKQFHVHLDSCQVIIPLCFIFSKAVATSLRACSRQFLQFFKCRPCISGCRMTAACTIPICLPHNIIITFGACYISESCICEGCSFAEEVIGRSGYTMLLLGCHSGLHCFQLFQCHGL